MKNGIKKLEKLEEYINRTKSKEEQEKERAAAEKFAECGALGITYEEHKFFGTPPAIQYENPGKTLAELMSDDEILDLLRSSAKALATLKKEAPLHGPQWIDVLHRQIEHMKRDMRYLEKIGRLPKEFQNFDVDSISPDE